MLFAVESIRGKKILSYIWYNATEFFLNLFCLVLGLYHQPRDVSHAEIKKGNAFFTLTTTSTLVDGELPFSPGDYIMIASFTSKVKSVERMRPGVFFIDTSSPATVSSGKRQFACRVEEVVRCRETKVTVPKSAIKVHHCVTVKFNSTKQLLDILAHSCNVNGGGGYIQQIGLFLFNV